MAVNRPLGRLAALGAWRLGLSANQVTIISAFFTALGIAGIAAGQPTWPFGVGIACCLAFGYVLDSADGQLARGKGESSYAGEWLDHVIDSAKIAAMHLAVLVLMYRTFEVSTRWLFVPLVFSIFSGVHFFGMILTELLGRVAGTAAEGKSGSKVMALAKLPTDYGVLCWSFVLLGVPSVFLWVYALLAGATIGYTLLVLPVWWRRISRLGAA